MIRIAAISDTHNRHKTLDLDTLNECDIVIHAGDATGRGGSREIKTFLKWFKDLKAPYKVLVPGNHDWGFQKKPYYDRLCFEYYGVNLLIDNNLLIHYIDRDIKLNIYGMPWTPHFCNWAFNAGRDVMDCMLYDKHTGTTKMYPLIKGFTDLIPHGTNILVTHGPPANILDGLCFADGTPNGNHVGCLELRKRVELIRPKHHIFGHIHSGHGYHYEDGISYHNVSICDDCYYPGNPITIITYKGA
jgi:DNA repair exonuclease SbcCD nuclease subunit